MRNLVLSFFISAMLLLCFSTTLKADNPPDPGGDPTGNPVGGGSPVGSGLVITMILSAAYASKKAFKLFEEK